METIEDKIRINYQDWYKKGKLFGDVNIYHYEEFYKFGYNKPSAPSVYLLFLAEKIMKDKNKFPIYPFELKMNLNYPAFEGLYNIKQFYDLTNNLSKIKFIHENDGEVASLNFNGEIPNKHLEKRSKLVSYSFGKIIKKFFNDERSYGALLENISVKFCKEPENYSLDINLEVNEKIRKENKKRKLIDYFISGIGTQKDKEILRINDGKFVQVIFKND